MHAYIAGAIDRHIEELLHTGGIRTTLCSINDLENLAAQPVLQANVVILDLRERRVLPAVIGAITRQHPACGVIVVASSLDPALMLDAMRAGVSEFVTEPVSQIELNAAIGRLASKRPVADPGQVFAFIGAKGGVGTTTLAVNVATALVREGAPTLLIDLHVSYGDAAVFLGSEPRFSVADALENVNRLDEAFLRTLVGRTNFGLDVLASSDRGTVAPTDVRAVRGLIECGARHYPLLVLDVPRTDATMLDALEMVTRIVVVCNQELAAVRSASRMAAALRQRYGKDRVSVVVTRYDHVAEIGQKELERAMGGPVAHVFPSNYRLALGAVNVGRPLVLDNHNKLAASMDAFARTLLRPSAAAPEPPKRPAKAGVLGKLSLRA